MVRGGAPAAQLVLLDVDFTLIRPRRVFDARGYTELGARFGARLDPERYEQARARRAAHLEAGTLEHRSAQHRRFAIEIVRGHGRGRGGGRADRHRGRAGVGRSRATSSSSPTSSRCSSVLRASPAARSGSSPTPIASSSRSRRSSASPWTSRSPRVRTAGASRARRSSPPRSRSAARRAERRGDGGRQPGRRHRGRHRAAACAPCSSTAMGAIPDHAGERIGGLDELPPCSG